MANDLHYNSTSSSALSLSSVIARNYWHLIHEEHSNAKMELNFMLQFTNCSANKFHSGICKPLSLVKCVIYSNGYNVNSQEK
jgi:hypothetical protein